MAVFLLVSEADVYRCVFQHLMCAGLWCLVEGEEACQTKLDAPLEGTECGTDKVKPKLSGADWSFPS